MSGNGGGKGLPGPRRLRKDRGGRKAPGSLDLHAEGLSQIVVREKLNAERLGSLNYEVLSSLFMTITNANFE
jgi:hydroxylamine reductase